MTVIIAMIPQRGIVLAADSRTTDADGIIHDGVQKIHTIKFADDSLVLIAQSGNVELSNRAIELISKDAQTIPITDYRTVAELAEKAIAQIKDQRRIQVKGTAEELQKHFKDYEFSLMIAHFFKGSPYIFVLDFELGATNWVRNKNLICIGCARNLGYFLLKGFNVNSMTMAQAITAGVYAVGEISAFDKRCGLPVNVGVVVPFIRMKDDKTYESNHATIAPTTAIKSVTEELQRKAPEFQADWNSKMQAVIEAIVKSKQKDIDTAYQSPGGDNPDFVYPED